MDVDVEMSDRSLERLRLEVEALRASRRRLLTAADDDRRRLERELHDGVQQHLVALAANLQLASMAGEQGRTPDAVLEEARHDVRRALAAAAALAHRIYPPLVESGGLVAALRAVAVDVGRPIVIDVAPEAGLPAELVGTVYFCCVDVLEGAGTAPASVVVRVEKDALAFELSVDDASSNAAGATLDRLRDRVEALGGELTVRVDPGRGAWFRGSLPLEE